MNAKISISAVVILIGVCCHCSGEEESGEVLKFEKSVERAFESIAEDSKADDINKSLAQIYKAKGGAIPVLLRYIRSEKPAPSYFEGGKVSVDPETGEISVISQNMGDVALMIIRSQVLGRVPLTYRIYEPLRGVNATELWLKERTEKSLLDIQIEAAEEALATAGRDEKLKPSVHAKGAMKYFAKRLDELKKMRLEKK